MLACYIEQERGRCETGIIFEFFFGEVAERSNAAVLKTVGRDERPGGSNPSLSAGRTALDCVKIADGW